MSIDSVQTLLAVLRRVELLAPEQVDEVETQLGPVYRDPQELGEYLVQIDWLTPFQLQALLSGRWDELTVGPYQVLDRLGEGGLSEVFKAWDTQRGRVAALKVLRQHLAADSRVVRQFQRELKAVTSLSHPNIIKTYDAGRLGGAHYFAMEFVEGMDLDRLVRQQGPLKVEQACEYARQVAQGLQYAHQHGLVHRDIKPANLFLVSGGVVSGGKPAGTHPSPLTTHHSPTVKIIDWGLARCLRGQADGSDPDPASLEELQAEKGHLIGTADYIAPEQAQEPTLVDTRADIYSLGCTLYYLLTGQPVFPGTSLMQKLLQHQEADPPSVRALRPDVPEELDAVVRKMLAKAPLDRYQIPLLVVSPLRRFCPGGAVNGARPGSAQGTAYRPGSAPALAPLTGLNLPRPGTAVQLQRPGSAVELDRPQSSAALPRRP